MITRFSLITLFCLATLIGFSQKRNKGSNRENVFNYSYKCMSYDYRPKSDFYNIKILELTSDSILITGLIEPNTFQGIITYEYDSVSDTISTNGNFQLKFPKAIKSEMILLNFQFEGYEENYNYVRIDEIPEDYFLAFEKESIFDPETGYVTIQSKTPLTKEDLQKIIDCLGSRKRTGATCYDPNSIQVTFAV